MLLKVLPNSGIKIEKKIVPRAQICILSQPSIFFNKHIWCIQIAICIIVILILKQNTSSVFFHLLQFKRLIQFIWGSAGQKILHNLQRPNYTKYLSNLIFRPRDRMHIISLVFILDFVLPRISGLWPSFSPLTLEGQI